MASEQIPNRPELCANGCGFYSNAATGGLCSKCYKESLKEEETRRPETSFTLFNVGAAATDSRASLEFTGPAAADSVVTSAASTGESALADHGVGLCVVSEESPKSPKLCTNRCGFYGNAATGDLCSMCYRDSFKEETKTSEESVPQIVVATAVADSLGCEYSTTPAPATVSTEKEVNQRVGPEQIPDSLNLCTNSCGFYGSTAYGGLCSRCYIDLLKKETKRPESSVAEIDTTTTTSCESFPSGGGVDLSARGRCASCNRKLGLLKGFPCKCGNSYCASHRYAEQHQCRYDYKSAGRGTLEKTNPIVKSDKIQRF